METQDILSELHPVITALELLVTGDGSPIPGLICDELDEQTIHVCRFLLASFSNETRTQAEEDFNHILDNEVTKEN
tara:strand:- start:1278 stop:1505 length:228 start_codon:yes stop_codon:yes gene_type:complete